MGEVRQSDVAGGLVGGPGPARILTLIWDNPPNVPPGTVTEIWASPDLVNWQLATNVPVTVSSLPSSDFVGVPEDKPQEFFRVRYRTADGLTSDWSTKKP